MLSASASSRWVPQRTAWDFIRSIRSGPSTPSGKPGKFSTWVVVISWPPGMPPRWNPVISSG